MEILSLFLSAWSAIAPYLAVLEPLLKLVSPVLTQLSPVLDLVGGPVSFVLVWVLAPAYLLWVFYLAIMTLKRSRDEGRLTGVPYALAWPVLIVGYVIDFYVTITFGTIVFADIPRETTFTARLQRYAKQPGTRRFAIMVWFAAILDRFDPAGYHIAEAYIVASETKTEHASPKAVAAIQDLLRRLSDAGVEVSPVVAASL